MHSARRALAIALLLLIETSSLAWSMPRGDTLDAVRRRGHVVCGVDGSARGFASHDSSGRWSGIEIDACRALAAALFAKPDAVSIRFVLPAERYQALRSGDIDVLAARTAWTITRDTALGLRFVAPLAYDGTAMMVPRRQGVSSTLELSGVGVCALEGAEGAETVRDYFTARRMRVRTMTTAPTWDALVKAYTADQCIALAGDASMLAATRVGLDKPDDHVILPERLVAEPTGLFVREGSERWFSVVRWTLFALIAAEEAGITSATVQSFDQSTAATLTVRRLLGLDSHQGRDLGLKRTWTRDVVQAVGNYGEMYDRHLGAKSPLKLERGLNNLWSKGGLMMAPSFR